MDISRDIIILESMPFSRGIKNWAIANKKVLGALKTSHPPRFITLQAICTSYCPLYPDDEIIGFYTYDATSKTIMFKQDFIVNIDSKDNDFVLYTRLPSRQYDKNVKDINDFFQKYSKGLYYTNSHHVTYENLPDLVKPRATQAVQLANMLKNTGLRKFTQSELEEFYLQMQKLVDTEPILRYPI